MIRNFSPGQSAASFIACFLAGATSHGQAEVVSVNFREDNGNLNQLIEASTTAGGGAGIGVSNWNDAVGASGEITDVIDDAGSETTLDLTWNSGGTWGDGSANADADGGVGNAQLQRGYLDDNQGANGILPIDITIAQVPYSEYSLVVYFSTDTDSDTYGDFTVTDSEGITTASTTGIKQLWGNNPNLDETNSVLVSGLTGDLTLNFPVRDGPTRHSVSGLQIIASDGSSSLPLTLEIERSSTGTNLYDFTWSSKEGSVYDLVSSPDLSTSPATWQVWEGQSNLTGTGEEITLSDLPSGDSKRFFAIIEK